MEYALQTKQLTKKYKETDAVNKVNMTIKRGDIYGLIGKNGAGKTTIMRLISGLIDPTAGEIRLFESNDLGIQRRRMGTSIENPALYYNMSARDNVEAVRILLGIPDKKIVEEVLTLVELSVKDKKKIKDYSMGMKQRLQIAITLLDHPDFLMLDEPMNGLDPEGIIQMRDLMLRLNKEKGVTILLSSHILGELSKIATCYGILHQGNLIEEFSKEELQVRCKRCIKMKVQDVQKATNVLETVCNMTNYDVLPENTIRLFDSINNPGFVNTELIKHGIVVESIQSVGQDLESYFMDLMGGEKNE